jgi:hypothetical protein
MQTSTMGDSQMSDYTKEQLIDALVHEWEYLCHDDPDPDDDTPEEYRLKLECYSLEELIIVCIWLNSLTEETSTGEGYTLDEFMENHG